LPALPAHKEYWAGAAKAALVARGVLAVPCLAAEVGDAVLELRVALDDLDTPSIDLVVQATEDGVETFVVPGLRELLDLARESGLVSFGH
jgi:hypothetical protein